MISDTKDKGTKKSKKESPTDPFYMRDKHGLPLNEAVRAPKAGKYGALQQY